MGAKSRNSAVNVLCEKLKKLPMKVKIFLGVLLAVIALLVLKSTIRRRFYFFLASQVIHSAGLSLITQELTALFLTARLLSRKFNVHKVQSVIDLVSLSSTLVIIWMIRFKLKSSYIKELDNMKLYFVVVPSAILATLIHPYINGWRITGFFMAFSIYLEAVSVIPQLRFMQNAKMIETFTGYYVFALGVSRFMALAHWIVQICDTRGTFLFLAGSGYFWFLAAFVAEIVQSFILADFCYYYTKSFIQGQLLKKMPI
ncbi:ER lumen protein-retaining receptor 1-A-like [Vigna unguiculata]|uniref:ER lumen protein-retaining receptor 1-A-like n=1 Tax=Vigna unguiculata TaxID=3917 RepID=UPI0010166302|nr:ER lumen protein-retaining receptor 1-A-like [Vigna unguiculata]